MLFIEGKLVEFSTVVPQTERKNYQEMSLSTPVVGRDVRAIPGNQEKKSHTLHTLLSPTVQSVGFWTATYFLLFWFLCYSALN